MKSDKIMLISNVLNLRFNGQLTESLCQKENNRLQFETPLFVDLTKRGVFFGMGTINGRISKNTDRRLKNTDRYSKNTDTHSKNTDTPLIIADKRPISTIFPGNINTLIYF